MSKITGGFTMSLDGFIAKPNDEVGELFNWYFSGDTEVPLAGTDLVFKVSKISADLLGKIWPRLGAFVTGRRDFEVSNAWGGAPPLGAPTFIVTHRPGPPEWVKAGSPFTFVHDGIESALEQARAAAGDKDVAVGGTTIIQQCLQAGLLDEIHIDLVPVLLGEGIRLFDNLPAEVINMEIIHVVAAPDVTHIAYRVVK